VVGPINDDRIACRSPFGGRLPGGPVLFHGNGKRTDLEIMGQRVDDDKNGALTVIATAS
jgi:hypothetical protein